MNATLSTTINYQASATIIKPELSCKFESYQTSIFKTNKTNEIPTKWVIFRLTNKSYWYWHPQENIYFLGAKRTFNQGQEVQEDIKTVLTEVNNDRKWHLYKREPLAAISHRYILRCIYINGEQKNNFDKIINEDDIWQNQIDNFCKICVNKWKNSVKMFELGIQILYEIKFVASAHYLKDLMVKRCLQIWPCISREQIIRGLALTKLGEKYLDAQIDEFKAYAVIQKTEQESWQVVNNEGLMPEYGNLFDENGITAARLRARNRAS